LLGVLHGLGFFSVCDECQAMTELRDEWGLVN
jgi:hypothetical protein